MHNKHSIVRVKKGKKKKRTAVCQSKNIDSPPSNRLISLEKEKKKRWTKKRRVRSSQIFVSSLIEMYKANHFKVQHTMKRKTVVPYACIIVPVPRVSFFVRLSVRRMIPRNGNSASDQSGGLPGRVF